jgi:hypothetical protein
MASDKPPAEGGARTIRSFAEYEEFVRAEEAAWSRSPP